MKRLLRYSVRLNVQRHDSAGGKKISVPELNGNPARPIKLLKTEDRWLHQGLADFVCGLCGKGRSCDDALGKPQRVRSAHSL